MAKPKNTEIVDQETGEVISNQELPAAEDIQTRHDGSVSNRRVLETLISGAEFHNFDEEPIFEGAFQHAVIREKDGPNAATDPNEKAGSVMGYLFVDDSGMETIIGNSHSVAKAIGKVGKGDILRFQFLGKGQTASNKPFNRFKIDLMG